MHVVLAPRSGPNSFWNLSQFGQQSKNVESPLGIQGERQWWPALLLHMKFTDVKTEKVHQPLTLSSTLGTAPAAGQSGGRLRDA